MLRPVVNLIILDVQLDRIWNPVSQLGVLHSLEIHFESLQVDQQQLGPLLYHHLPCRHLFGVARFAVELVGELEELFCAEFLEAVAKGDVLLDIY